MTTHQSGSLRTLSDRDLTVAQDDIDIRGRSVVDRSGDDIGTVDALLIDDQESKVRFLRVASGGFLGIGEKTFLIPVDAVTRIAEETVTIDQEREHVADSPAYDPAVAPKADYYTGLYSHYGYSPYWTTGYAYPMFPHYR